MNIKINSNMKNPILILVEVFYLVVWLCIFAFVLRTFADFFTWGQIFSISTILSIFYTRSIKPNNE